MAKKEESKKREMSIVDPDQVSVGGEIEFPPVLRESKYKWGSLLAADPGKSHIFVEFPSKEEASKARSSIQSSGLNYFRARELPLKVKARVVELDDGRIGVAAITVPTKQE